MGLPTDAAAPQTPDTVDTNAPTVRVKQPFFKRRIGRVTLWVGLPLLAVALVLTGYLYCCGVLGANFHEVSAGPSALYRSAQLGAEDLKARIGEHRIKTVVNLRGENPGKAWYDEETAALQEMGVKRIDVKMSGKHMPSRDKLVQLVRALQTAERPVLVHCQSGADRTGLACAFERLATSGNDFTAARRELVFWPYGHTGYFGYESMDRVVDQFEAYKKGGGALGLLEWAEQVYDPGADVD